jgi:hypothetical protein
MESFTNVNIKKNVKKTEHYGKRKNKYQQLGVC